MYKITIEDGKGEKTVTESNMFSLTVDEKINARSYTAIYGTGSEVLKFIHSIIGTAQEISNRIDVPFELVLLKSLTDPVSADKCIVADMNPDGGLPSMHSVAKLLGL